MKTHVRERLWAALTSLKLTIVCLAILMVLVVACTLAQVELGTYGAVSRYIRSFFVWWQVPGLALSLPIFPGGALVGLVLGANLVAAQAKRLELSWKKAGLWIVHAGLILLFVGEFVTGAFQVETRLAVEEGQTVDFVESTQDVELAVVDVTDPAHDDVYGVPEGLVVRGAPVPVAGTPLTLDVKAYYRNAHLANRGPADPPSPATAGVGPGITVHEARPVTRDDEVDLRAVFVEPRAGEQRFGVFLVSNAIPAPQRFTHAGRTFEISLRPRREYLPYSLTLKDFRHDVYAGTDIPKNFSSLVRLSNPGRGEERDVLIYMNQPLRYGGKAFYQASFGKGDTLSILQVVENPGWLLPYVACVLVGAGLVLHFAFALQRGLRRREGEVPEGAVRERAVREDAVEVAR